MEIDPEIRVLPQRKTDEYLLQYISLHPNLFEELRQHCSKSNVTVSSISNSTSNVSPTSPIKSPKVKDREKALSPKDNRLIIDKENRDPNSPNTSRRTNGLSQAQSPPPKSPGRRLIPQKKQKLESPIAPFYFPKKFSPQTIEREIEMMRSSDYWEERMIDEQSFAVLLREYCQFPTSVSCLIFQKLDPENTGKVSQLNLFSFWRKNMMNHDVEERIFNFLKGTKPNIHSENFIPLIRNIISNHPGLEFLKDSNEFQERYLETVLVRIFYRSCGSKKNFMTLHQFKQSQLFSALHQLDSNENINDCLSFFSYEHFYVIYCKFWELDKQHKLIISEEDLSNYENHALSSRIIKRIVSQPYFKIRSDLHHNVLSNTRGKKMMGYQDFVWFILSEEDKNTETSLQFWFDSLDIDGDGYLSTFEIEYFYKEQADRLQRMNIEPVTFQDILCQILDIIKPRDQNRITFSDIKRCKQSSHVFNILFNIPKFLNSEDHQERFLGSNSAWNHQWNSFATNQYELLTSDGR